MISGHGRLAAARELGMTTVPCVFVDHLTPNEIKELALAENRIAQSAG